MALGPPPVPVRLTDCWLPATLLLLSVMTRFAVRLEAAVGVKVTLIVQPPLAATELPHVLVCAKSPGSAPVNAMLVIDKLVFPVLLRVTACAELVVPTFRLANVRLVVVTLATGPLPVPVTPAVWGLLVALSVIAREAVRLPVAVGVKVTLIVQLAFAATELGHVEVSAKSPELAPVKPMPLSVKLAFPELVRVSDWIPLVDPTEVPPKVSVEGETCTTGPLPVPLKLIACGLPGALSVMVTEAERLPMAVGAKVTLTLQFPPAGSELGQVLVWLKSPAFVPDTATEVMLMAAVPVLLRVTGCAALVVPRVWAPNVRLVAVRLSDAPPPVPARLTVCGLPEAESLMLSPAVRAPGDVGVKVRLMVQLAAAARELPQLLDCAKSPGLAPVSETPAMLTLPVPVLFTVTIWAVLVVPTVWVGKVRLIAERLI